MVSMDLTTAGLKLYGKMQIGLTSLNVSRVVIGVGHLNGNETALDLDALKNEVDVTTLILGNEIVGNGQTKLSFRITGGHEDFYLREIGVMAIDPDEGEILYCYCNYGDCADYVMVYGGILPVTQEADIYFAIGVGSIKVEFAKETAAVSYKDFEAHTSDKENPHGVTAAQVFPDNANVLKNITADNIKDFKAAVNEKHIHENKSVLDKITSTVFEKWNNAVSHITNKGNPHGVTKSQIGLGNVVNESKKTMFNSPEFTGTPIAPTAAAGTSSAQIATTAFVKNVLDNDYGDVTLGNTLEVVSATGSPGFYHFTPSANHLLDTVITTFGKAEFGEAYGNYSAQVGQTISLYITLRIKNGVVYWDEYYNNSEGDIYIGTATVVQNYADSKATFSYYNDEFTAKTMSMRNAIIELANQIQILMNK